MLVDISHIPEIQPDSHYRYNLHSCDTTHSQGKRSRLLFKAVRTLIKRVAVFYWSEVKWAFCSASYCSWSSFLNLHTAGPLNIFVIIYLWGTCLYCENGARLQDERITSKFLPFLEGESCYISRHPFNLKNELNSSFTLSVLLFTDTPSSKWTLIYYTNERHGGKCFLKTTSTGIHGGSDNHNWML